MTARAKSELLELKKNAIDGMVSYMKSGEAESEDDPDYDPEFDAGYTQEHVDQCSKIIDDLLAGLSILSGPQKEESILKLVQVAVVELNKINEKCDGSLIETEQREELCELIILAAKHAGLESGERDITEEWREW